MEQDVYRQLMDVMKARGGAYAGADIPEFYAMAKVLFTPEEALVNNAMPKEPVTADQMAQIMEKDRAWTAAILEDMANKGLCMAMDVKGVPVYKSARFMIGIFEFQFMPGQTTERDREIARAIYAYKKAFEKLQPPEQDPKVPSIRVITVDKAIHPEDRVHTYDQVQTYINENELIAITACYCRHAALLRGEDIHGMPTDTCMQFGPSAQFAIERLGARKVSREEARQVLDRAEDAGLIHMSQNMAEGIGFICNCDRWHCTPVTQALKAPKPSRIMSSGFLPQFDPESCVLCGTCEERCPAAAIATGDEATPGVDPDRCFGCGACASGCPSEAISLVQKPDYAAPPQNAKELRQAMKA